MNFGTDPGPGTDLHHIRATDVSVNSSRGNFDNGGTPHLEATDCKYDNDSWEPRDNVKGEIDLELNDRVNNNTSPYMGRISVLLQWHKQDPVDDLERRRNELIYTKYQQNRNSFIDYPEWIQQIWNSY